MSFRYQGGVISATPPTVNSIQASGLWTPPQQLYYESQGLWPPYEIAQSLRFNSADSTYLNRTPASAGNQKTWTWSGWVKKSGLAQIQTLFARYTANSDAGFLGLYFNTDETLNFTGWSTVYRTTSSLYRDVSAWYHIVLSVDTTQATAANRIKLYVNGSEVTAFSTSNNPSQNADLVINAAAAHEIGRYASSNYLNGYMTETNFIDGQALTPSSFGAINPSTGVWSAKKYTGTYGTNGFYLNFSDNSGTTSTTLGKDYSGNGNNWTPNNFSVTAGSGNDSLTDVPSYYGVDTGVGGQVRGNYATLNPLVSSVATLANGNLDWSQGATAYRYGLSTIAIPLTGKYIVEVVFNSTPTTNLYNTAGVINSTGLGYLTTTMVQAGSGFYGVNDASSTYGQSFVQNGTRQGSITVPSGTIIQLLIDRDNNQLTFTKNGTLQTGTGSTVTIPSGVDLWAVVGDWGASGSVNFGQRPFAYTAPSGFKALCTTNLPDQTVVQGDDYFNTVLYTGTGASQSITGVGFQPDFVWIKERNAAADHGLYDVVRGVQKQLESNTTTAETTETTGLTAFGSDGFTVGALAQLNTNTDTYVSWNWNAGGSNATNTDGTITSTVRANPTAGFSIVTATTPASGTFTVGHGLGVAPSMVIAKGRETAGYTWNVYHKSLGAGGLLVLNTTAAFATNTGVWQNTAPSSSVIYGNSTNWGGSEDYVIYAFAEVEGYSAFGSYTGNGSTDGPFVYLGFRPSWVLIKRTDTTNDWYLNDTARNPYNVAKNTLLVNTSDAEGTLYNYIDVLSNGFKCRTADGGSNASGGTYIYAAFAENPFKFSLAR